jgi:hypothetical protein
VINFQKAYPLHWPAGWPRTKPEDRRSGTFRQTMGKALDELFDELDRWGAENCVVSTDLRPRLDGRPYANQPKVDDPGVAVYFRLGDQELSMACDTFEKIEHNVRAIGLSVANLRSLERYGTSQILERAFRGFTALPEPGDAWGTLCLDRRAITAMPKELADDAIRDAFRSRARQMHPDTGGTDEGFEELERARDAALAEVRA